MPRSESGGLSNPFHESAWECPRFSQKFLGALQSLAQKGGPGTP
ncbi:MAG: hypothetical protein WB809_06405 [Thermoplasmata archaeon]